MHLPLASEVFHRSTMDPNHVTDLPNLRAILDSLSMENTSELFVRFTRFSALSVKSVIDHFESANEFVTFFPVEG